LASYEPAKIGCFATRLPENPNTVPPIFDSCLSQTVPCRAFRLQPEPTPHWTAPGKPDFRCRAGLRSQGSLCGTSARRPTMGASPSAPTMWRAASRL